MPRTLHVRGVPDELYDALRQSAADNGRSITAETIAILESSLVNRTQAMARIKCNIEKRRARRESPHQIDATKIIREDRDRGSG